MAKDRKLFLTDHCLTPLEKIPNGAILCERDRVIGIGGASGFSQNDGRQDVIDLRDCYAVPGFIDSHIHGIGRFDAALAASDPDTLNGMSELLVKHGVTSFCPTLSPAPAEQLLNNINILINMIEAGTNGADAVGLHLEGPFINPEKRGSQSLDGICPEIDLEYARRILEAGRGRIKLMTFAPELDNAEKLVELMLAYGTIPSMGRSLATEKEAMRCIEAGARRCTYVFNGMPPLYHRESSLTDVALSEDRVTVEMICDGTHIHPRFVDMTARCKPQNKIVGISNAVATPDALPMEIPVPNNAPAAIVTTSDGVISGATMTLENSWRHLMEYARMDRPSAAACFTSNPADDLGLITRGRLMPGRRADITFFDSKTNRVRMTVVRGKIIYQAEGTHA